MPAQVVLVHDLEFLSQARPALEAAGYEVAAFSGTMTVLNAIEAAKHIELLITIPSA